MDIGRGLASSALIASSRVEPMAMPPRCGALRAMPPSCGALRVRGSGLSVQVLSCEAHLATSCLQITNPTPCTLNSSWQAKERQI
jgi:hypothetical protein